MASLDNLQNRKIIGITDGEVAMPVIYNENIQDSKYFYNCNVISLAATIARTIDKDRLFRGIFYDTSIKRSQSDASAAEIFAIGKALFNDTIQYGIWKISTANVHQNDLVNVGWELVKQAPDKFIDAAIAFDGIWKLTEDFKYYSLFTEETPLAFYITNDNVLYYWNYRTNLVQQLDTNVTHCAAERGYLPEDYVELNSDQGVIVVYATAQQEVKYFTYSLTSAAGFKQWLGPDTIASFPNEKINSVQVHRLNDYRIGVLITTDKKSYWYITDRVYSQMAFKPEKFILNTPVITPIFHVAMRMDKIAATPQPQFNWELNEEKNKIVITSNAELKFYDNFDVQKIITGSANMPAVRDITISKFQIVINLIKGALATFKITLNFGNIRCAGCVTDMLENAGGWVALNPISHTFEIYEKYEYSELFILSSPKINNIKGTSYIIYTIAQDYNSEKFMCSAPKVLSVSCAVYDTRTRISIDNPESFTMRTPKILNISATVENTSIMPI